MKIVELKGDGELIVSDDAGKTAWRYSPRAAYVAEHAHPEVLALPAADLEKIHANKKK